VLDEIDVEENIVDRGIEQDYTAADVDCYTLILELKILIQNISSILNICLLLLKNCQLAIVYTDILLCFISPI
jgi:hypothetical protein